MNMPMVPPPLKDSWPIPLCRPVRIETHSDPGAHARKDLGFDEQGLRCYYRHEFVVFEERFDADEWPVRVAIYHEELEAWRLDDGRWLSRRSHCDNPDACSPKYVQVPLAFSRDCPGA